MDDKFCPCCKNRCPADSLSCGRGRAYFGMGRSGDESEAHGGHGGHTGHEQGGHGFPEGGDEIVNLLRKCGHTLHHAYGHGDVRLDCLTEEERTQLAALLNKCLKNLEG